MFHSLWICICIFCCLSSLRSVVSVFFTFAVDRAETADCTELTAIGTVFFVPFAVFIFSALLIFAQVRRSVRIEYHLFFLRLHMISYSFWCFSPLPAPAYLYCCRLCPILVCCHCGYLFQVFSPPYYCSFLFIGIRFLFLFFLCFYF